LIPKEWLEDYFRKSGDTELLDGNLLLLPYGFIIYEVDGDVLGLLHVYATKGSGKKMDKFINSLAKEIGAKKIRFATRRRPEGFVRKYNYKVVGYVLEKEVE